ncbi:MAG: PHP domain-containing protein [Chloroflexi bacterium]|nr:PHP domain-containing protein [Chloroflexota bacterium]
MLKVDLHLHTKYSLDSHAQTDDIIAACLAHGITCLAVTDHGQTEGAFEIAARAPFKVIIGEEILTPYGEIIGLFLKEKIQSPCGPEEAVAEIKKQGGLVIIPHPFDSVRATALDNNILNRLVNFGCIDAIEVLNGRIIYNKDIKRALKYAEGHSLLKTAGSDSHRIDEIGNAYLETEDFDGPQEFLQALKTAKIVNKRSSFLGIRTGALWERAANRKNAKKTRYIK